MKKLFLVVAAAAMLIMPLSAQASEKTGFYIAPKFVLSVQQTKTDAAITSQNTRDAGYSFANKKTTDTHSGGAIAVGYDFSKKFDLPVRAELEYGAYDSLSGSAHGKFDFIACDFEVGIQTLLINVYGDLFTWNKLIPYIGGGIGMAFIESKYNLYTTQGADSHTGSQSHTKTSLAGHITLGCSYAFSDTISADLGYRFLMMGNGNTHYNYQSGSYNESNALTNKHNRMHQFMFGLRVTF